MRSVVQVWPDYTCHTHKIIAREAKKRTNENLKRFRDTFFRLMLYPMSATCTARPLFLSACLTPRLCSTTVYAVSILFQSHPPSEHRPTVLTWTPMEHPSMRTRAFLSSLFLSFLLSLFFYFFYVLFCLLLWLNFHPTTTTCPSILLISLLNIFTPMQFRPWQFLVLGHCGFFVSVVWPGLKTEASYVRHV